MNSSRRCDTEISWHCTYLGASKSILWPLHISHCIKIFRVKIDLNCNNSGSLHHPFWLLTCFGAFGISRYNVWNYFVWLRITDEGSVPEMRIWSILLFKSDLKWCIHLTRGLFIPPQWISKLRCILESPCPSVCPSACLSVCRRARG